MAVDFININVSAPTTSPQANLLKQYVETLRQAYNVGKRCRDMMAHMNDGSSFTSIESNFGLAANKGQIVFDLVNGSIGAMEGTFQNDDSKQITEQVG